MELYFDMDGTVYDLYGTPDWLERITKSDVTIFEQRPPCVNLDKLNTALAMLVDCGFKIGVITWLPKNATTEYKQAVTKAKKDWITKNIPLIDVVIVQEYGTPKYSATNKRAILVDDNDEVRKDWETNNYKAIDAKQDIIPELLKLI